MNILNHKTIATSFGNIELITAKHSTHHFPRHFHETFPFGVVTNGALGFHYRGEKVTASRGTINLANPGEVHDGFPAADSGWQYRMFYIDQQVVNEILNLNREPGTFPWFSSGVIRDEQLAVKIAWLHYKIEKNFYEPLETETQFAILLEELFTHYARQVPQPFGFPDRHALQPIFDQIREYSYYSFTLKQLAETCGFSVGYFIRAFKKLSGLTPHQYQLVCRMERARREILANKSISDVAISNGFVDQSHFHKTFKHFYGYTPAALYSS